MNTAKYCELVRIYAREGEAYKYRCSMVFATRLNSDIRDCVSMWLIDVQVTKHKPSAWRHSKPLNYPRSTDRCYVRAQRGPDTGYEHLTKGVSYSAIIKTLPAKVLICVPRMPIKGTLSGYHT